MNWFYRQRWIIVAFFVLLVIVVLFSGYTISKKEKQEVQNGVKSELRTIANLKIDEISEWYTDQLDDAGTIAQDFNLIKNIELWLKSSGKAYEVDLLNRFHYLQDQHSLSEIMLFSLDGKFLISSGNRVSINDTVIEKTLGNCLKFDKPQSTDLYYCHDCEFIHIDFISPVKSTSGGDLCFIVYVVDANKYLYPYVNKWPVQSKTAETLILRKENKQVLFLNELRHLKGTALNLQIPLSRTNVPAVMAVNGFSGTTWGTDYRNEEVLAYTDKIPGTPWYFVAKIDKKEIFDQPFLIKYNFLIVTGFFILLLFLVFTFIFTQWQKNSYKSQFQAQQEFRTIIYSIGDAVIITNKDGLIKNLNSVAELVTGWTESEAMNQPIENVFRVEDEIKREKIIRNGQSSQGAHQIETSADNVLLLTKDGRTIPVSNTVAPILYNEGKVDGSILVFRDQSEEIEKSRLVEEQRRQLYTLMSNLPGIAYRCLNDHEWTMEFISKGCLDLTGYDVDELVDNHKISYADIIAEKYRDTVWDQVQQACNNKRSFELEYQIVTKGGTRKWVWEKGQGVYDENGNLEAIEGFITDINKRKLFESALAESEHRFQMIAENSTVGIFKTNPEGGTTYVNPKWCEITGLSEQEALGKGWIKQVHPDDRKKLHTNWEKSIQENKPSAAEYRFVRADKTVVYVKGLAVPEFNKENKLTGYIGTITDVSDIKKAEEQLKSSNLLLRTLIDNIPDAIYIKDLEGRKVLANKADLINIGAKSEDEVIGKTDFEVFPNDVARQFHEIDQEVLRTGKPVLNHEEELINENNVGKWLTTSKIPYRDAKGKIVGLIGIGHDMTERKNLMSQLIEAKERAEESEKLKTSFLANMSHEIRTPLNSILGFTNILLESDDLEPEEKEEYISIIDKSSASLLQIINDIIDISSLETGQMKIGCSTFFVNDTVSRLYKEFSKRVDELNNDKLELRILNPEDKLELYTDNNRLNQIFINLLTNALKFTTEGYIEFGIEKYDDQFVYFKVEDTGIGIPEDSHQLIFERFRQAEDNNTRQYGGNGLGLSIVKNLIALMGGDIKLESEPGVGSTFRFYLPYRFPKTKA